MRVKCPYCSKGFAVYPIPTQQAMLHRRAGLYAFFVQCVVAFLLFGVLGPDVISDFSDSMIRAFGPRAGMGMTAVVLGAPLLFVGLAAYDRFVPQFGRPVGDELHCTECGYTLKGLREPRCPECGRGI